MTRDDAIARLTRSLPAPTGGPFSKDYADALLTALEMLEVLKFDTPEDVHREGCKFIHNLSPLWARTNPGAVVEDLQTSGYRIVRA